MKCICGNQRFETLFSGEHKFSVSQERKKRKFKYSILQCSECSLVQTHPRPYENSFNSQIYQDQKDVDDKMRRFETFQKYAQFALCQIGNFKKNGAFLDIGASIGVLVNEAQKQGFNAQGIEINDYAIQKAKEIFDITLLKVDLFERSLREESVDVVTLIQVFEHVENPVSFLKHIKYLLKTDAILYISVPNFDGYMVQFKKQKWGGLDPMRHLWQWTPLTLTHVLEQAGYHIERFILSHNMDHYAYELARDNFILRKWKEYLLRKSTRLNRGDHLICIARNKISDASIFSRHKLVS